MHDINRQSLVINGNTDAAAIPGSCDSDLGATPLFIAYRHALAEYLAAVECNDAAVERNDTAHEPHLRALQDNANDELWRCIYAVLERPCTTRRQLREAALVCREMLCDEGVPVTAESVHSSNGRMEAGLLRSVLEFCEGGTDAVEPSTSRGHEAQRASNSGGLLQVWRLHTARSRQRSNR